MRGASVPVSAGLLLAVPGMSRRGTERAWPGPPTLYAKERTTKARLSPDVELQRQVDDDDDDDDDDEIDESKKAARYEEPPTLLQGVLSLAIVLAFIYLLRYIWSKANEPEPWPVDRQKRNKPDGTWPG